MVFSRFEWMMAGRYLRARRQEGFISVIALFSLLGIMLGVGTLIVVMAVMNGFRAELLGRILGLNGHLMVQSFERGLDDHERLMGELKKLSDITYVQPVVDGQVMATANGIATGARVRGLDPEDLRKQSLVARRIAQGDLANFDGEDAVVIGDRMARTLGLKINDRVTLISPQTTATVFGTVPRLQAYRVVATFDIGMYEYDSAFVFMPLKQAQVYFRLGDKVSGIEVMLKDGNAAPQKRIEIANALGGKYSIYDWQQANAQFFNALQVERSVMFLILSLIILVAAFNIISSLIMLVKDKGRDIAILRTMGATRGSVMRVFFLSGAAVGVIGTVLGCAAGYAFAANIESIRRWLEQTFLVELFPAQVYFLSRLPAKVETMEVVQVVVMALALSLLATIYPSWRAARLDPVEALRYE